MLYSCLRLHRSTHINGINKRENKTGLFWGCCKDYMLYSPQHNWSTLDWEAGRVMEADNMTAINSFIQAPSLHLYKLFLLSLVCDGRPKAGRNNVFPLKRDAKHEEQLALAVMIILSLSARLFSAFGSGTQMNTIWMLRVCSAEALKLAAAC